MIIMGANIRNFTQLLKSNNNKPLPTSVPLQNNVRLAATPQEFNRLGTIPNIGNLPVTQLQALYYDIQCIELPLTNGEFDAICGVQRLFNCGPDITVGTCRVTNANCGAGINAPFVALGLAIIVIPEGHGWTLPGVACTSMAALQQNTICCDGFPGTMGSGVNEPVVPGRDLDAPFGGVPDMTSFCAANPGACCSRSDLAWGWPTWRLAEQLLSTLTLQFIVLNRWLVIEELLSLLAFYPNPSCFIGAFGDVTVAARPEQRWTNDTMRCKGIGLTHIGTNTIIDAATGESFSVVLGNPGQGFGSPNFSCGHLTRMWPFPTPLFFCPGYRIDIQFVPQIACDALAAMRELAVVNCTSSAAEFSGPLVCTIPAGQLRLGVVLLGFEIWPSALLPAISATVASGSMQAQMLQGVPYIYELWKKMEQSGQLDDRTKNRLNGLLGRAPSQLGAG